MIVSIQKKIQDFVLGSLTGIFHFIVIFVIILINILISIYIRQSDFFFVANDKPIGFAFGWISSIAILIFVSWSVWYFQLINKSAVNTILIVSGMYSNFIEKIIWSNVADYMNFYIANINLADIQIFLGILLLNFQIWFVKSLTHETILNNPSSTEAEIQRFAVKKL